MIKKGNPSALMFKSNPNADLRIPLPVCKGGFLVISHPQQDEICRICLRTDLELTNMQKTGLADNYLNLTGVEPRSEPALPQAVCGFCAHQLRKFLKLQQSARLANDTLHRLLSEHGRVSIETLKTVDIKPSALRVVLPPSIISLTEDSDKESVKEKAVKRESSVEDKVNEDPFYFTDDVVYEVEVANDDVEIIDNNKGSDDACAVNRMNIDENFNHPDTEPEQLQCDILDDDANNANAESSARCDKTLESSTKSKYKSRVVNFKHKPTIKRVPISDEELRNHFTTADLSPDEQRSNVLKRKEKDNFRQNVYQCQLCFKGFCRSEPFEEHMKKHTDVAKYGKLKCPACLLLYRRPSAMRHHIRASHETQFVCRSPECSFITFSRGNAEDHLSIHKGVEYKCPHCDATYKKLSSCLGHLRIVHSSDFVCELCGYSFVSRLGIMAHKKIKHRYTDHEIPTDAPSCEVCDIKFISEDALRTHQRVSAKHKTEGRDSRNEPVQPKPYRLWLTTRVAKPPALSCEQCGLELPSPRAYFYHFRKRHPGETRTQYPADSLMCEQCGAIVQNSWHLRDHMRLHTPSQPLQCPHCAKSFATHKQRVVHARAAHGPRVGVDCAVCGKNIRNRCNLLRHMQTHKPVRPVPCESCDRRFTTKNEKKHHFRHKHLGVPYPKKKKVGAQISTDSPQLVSCEDSIQESENED